MTCEEYKQKLIAFNNTTKYAGEFDFLLRMMAPFRDNEKIMDYGCGLGRAVRHINATTKADCFGYDVRNYREQDDVFIFRSEYFFKFDKVFFMHSIAHIPEIELKLETLKTFLKPHSKIYVITPNKYWLREVNGREYVPDPTVINHYSALELEKLFTSSGYTVVRSLQFGAILNNQHERLFIEVTI